MLLVLSFLWPDWLSFEGLLKALRDAAVWSYETLRDILWALLSPVFEALIGAVELLFDWVSSLATSLGVFSEYLAFANAWVPVDVFFQLCTAYSVFWLAVLTYRTIKSWIPTVSGGG